MSAPARTVPASSFKPGGLDPLRWLWNLLTNVKFALVLVGLAATAGFIGVVVPQMPGPMRGNPAARSAWLELQRDDFGPFTGLMENLGLFEVFYSTWFNGLWVLIVVAVTVCTVSRFRPTWRTVQRPQRQVSDSYFESAHHRADFSHAGGSEAVESALRRRHYAVERTSGTGDAAYLYAERFGWSHYGTFISHL
ncbi:MAG: cytochrome c biogenesis protein ResB, partial [Dehalococcoidia bacterium]